MKSNPDSTFSNEDYADYQMTTIKQLIKPHIDPIKASENEMSTLAYQMYEISKKFIDDIVHLNWQGPNSKLAILGGIMINCEGDKTDRFLPLSFEIRTKKETKDLFKDTFENNNNGIPNDDR